MLSKPLQSLLYTAVGLAYGLLFIRGAYGDTQLLPAEGQLQLLWLPLALAAFRARVGLHLLGLPGREALARRFYRLEALTFAPFLVALAFPARLVAPSFAVTIAACTLLAVLQALLFLAVAGPAQRLRLAASDKYIALLFLVSGFSALIYQVVWQRTLFSTFGINSESVTVIVSVFMFGLGVGALAGGYLQRRYHRHLLRLFLLLETLIGVFGLFSLDLIRLVGAASGDSPTSALVLWVYLILGIPTLLMGATLPILFAWLQDHLHHIGKSVGLLYAFNTIGSAIAAFLTVQMLFVLAGQRAAILVAAVCNFATAALIADAARKIRLGAPDPGGEPVRAAAAAVHPGPALPFAFVFLVLAGIGFISLSQEILWFRLLGFMSANRPQIFGLLLTAFLLGIAAGSLRSKTAGASEAGLGRELVRALFAAAAIFYLALPAVALLTAYAGKAAGMLLAYAAIAAVACYTGGILPLLVHMGVAGKPGDAAASMSWLYFANIIGATLGPLLTGFVLLDLLPLDLNIALFSALTLVLLLAVVAAAPAAPQFKAKALALAMALGGAGWAMHGALYSGYLEKLQYASPEARPFRHVVQNRSGIITVEAGETDILYGHGIYDGRFNTDPRSNSNGIDRAYMLASVHRQPRRILSIGLSTGAWARVTASYGPLERLDIVEINPGYPAIMRHYPAIGDLLDDPKVVLHFDDGRRWLRRHPEARYDLILMNTILHWRSNATNLLSKELLEMAKAHLLPGGVLYYNATGSPDVSYTAAQVFRHVTLYSSFVAASDAPFSLSSAERRANLLQFKGRDGGALFADASYAGLLDQYAQAPLPEYGPLLRAASGAMTITDDNMAVEYKVARYH
jgi:spermidine synthase